MEDGQNKAMASSYSSMLFIILVGSLLVLISAGILVQEFDLTWGESKIDSTGELLTLTLDQTSGSGFQSKNEYLFGEIDMQIKLVAGNSAGTVTAYYVSPLVLSLSLFVQLSSQGTTHDEIDFEFLGNLSGDPYILHTNVFSQGKGNREQQFYLWFDPTVDFHTYTIRWNPQRIAFLVDGIPIRVYKNPESIGVPYPKDQPMRIHSSLWNADNWATKGGLVKIDWSEAPFVASYRNFTAKACVWSSGSSSCPESLTSANPEVLDEQSQDKLIWVQNNYMIYNYCSDTNRFSEEGLPAECNMS